MEVTLLPNGLRDRRFRPYINEEELSKNVYLYDPNGPGFNYGLYQVAGQPYCGPWEQIYQQFPSKVPGAVIGPTGRLHMVRPSWWRGGLHYDSLLRHTSQGDY